MPEKVIQVVEALNSNTTTQIRVNNSLTEKVPIATGIRQGDSLSPQLFNLVMDEITADTRSAGRGFRTHKGETTILCYADDVVLISENEDELQRLLQFYDSNTMISVPKTKSLVIAKEPIRCKLVSNEIIEQVMSLKYLGIKISSSQDRKKKIQGQTSKEYLDT